MIIGASSSRRVLDDRRRYQSEVERLLEQIRGQVLDLRRLKAAGARGRTFSDRKQVLEQTRRQLATLISAGTRSARAA
jgi:hypothetical protein